MRKRAPTVARYNRLFSLQCAPLEARLARMTQSPILDALRASHPVLAAYSGVETAGRFGDGSGELRALTSDCGIYDLGWRAKLLVTGADRTRWLNGMVTNNIKDLPLNRGNYSFVLNPQGRIQGDLHSYNRGDSILLDSERAQVENLLKIFEHYIIMDDVEIADISGKLTAIGVQGPRAREVLGKAGIELPDIDAAQIVDLIWQGTALSVTRTVNEQIDTFEIWVDSAAAARLWNSLLDAGGTPAGTEALEKFRIMMGRPKYGTDIRERDLPQETGQRQALNFTKGCYVGQEIVERIRSRGAVHRQFTGFLVDGQTPEPGTKLEASGKEAGEITSADTISSRDLGERILALGYVRREALERKETLRYPGGTVNVSKLPFAFE